VHYSAGHGAANNLLMALCKKRSFVSNAEKRMGLMTIGCGSTEKGPPEIDGPNE